MGRSRPGLWSCSLAAVSLLSAAVAAPPCGEAEECAVAEVAADDEFSALQAARAPRKRRSNPSAESDEVHIVFTVDCSDYNLWQAELFFFSAQHVGQRGPITEIVSGCSRDSQKRVEERHATLGLPPHYKVHFLPELNDDRSHCINKPYGVAMWFREVGPERDVLAVVDPDFVMLKPLTATIDGAQTALGWPQGEFATVPQKVQKGVVVSQRWGLFQARPTNNTKPWHYNWMDRFPDNMTKEELFTWVCSGSRAGPSGCTNVSMKEVSYYHATGVPYIAHRADWDEWLVDTWRDVTKRLHEVYDGYIVDMLSWAFANIHVGKRQLVVHNLQFYHPGHYENWKQVEAMTADPCNDPMEKVLAEPGLAHFVHYTHVQDGWNKRWFMRNPFEHCEAPALSNFVAGKVNRTNTSHNNGWALMHCITRRMFAAAVKRTCAGHEAASLVDKASEGFSF